MSADIVKLPTARTSYFTVRKGRGGWSVLLVTPIPIGRRTMSTTLAKLRTFDDAVGYATHHGRLQQLPVRIGRHP